VVGLIGNVFLRPYPTVGTIDHYQDLAMNRHPRAGGVWAKSRFAGDRQVARMLGQRQSGFADDHLSRRSRSLDLSAEGSQCVGVDLPANLNVKA
jgi:hypothetical protein